MVNAMVERATSDMLIGPDWAMNIEICDICNRDPAQAKDVVKGVKKRLGSKNSKVQLLALTLLETIVKNCGDIIHMHVADKNLPHEMVKIVKKKPDIHVKEKVLTLIDTWQEAFGGSRARYPQYFVAYQDLLRLGAVFPERSESLAPVFTPAQTHPLSSYPPNMHNPESRRDAAESSAEAEYPTMSLTELQNAKGIMDVLAEMLNALDPSNKDGLKQEVIVDLVEQCRNYKQRVVHLINSTSDESLLSQGLALNDELQRVLANHDSIASGAPSTIQTVKPKPEPNQALVPVDTPLIDTGDSKQSYNGSTSGTTLAKQLSLPGPPLTTNGQLSTPSKADPKIDLLSGDDFNSSLAVVSVGHPQPTSPVPSQHNALALVDMFSDNSNNQTPNSGLPYSSSPQFQQQANFNSPQPSPQAPSPVYGASNINGLPPPPWEVELDSNVPTISQPQDHAHPLFPSGTDLPGSQTVAQEPVLGPHTPGTMQHSPVQNPHPVIMYPQPMQAGPMGYIYPQQMYGNQMGGIGYGYSFGYGYSQAHPRNAQFLQQSMTGLSLSNGSSVSSYVPTSKPAKPEDKLFGDLVDMSKFKPAKTA